MRDPDLNAAIAKVLRPERLWTRPEILAKSQVVPQADGFYVWYFRNLEKLVPTQNCHRWEDFWLLYVGIAPEDEESKSSLQQRVNNHVKGKASNSTLRRSLGALVHRDLGLVPRLTPCGKLHFGEGEPILSQWIDENAGIVWTEWENPWRVEETVIQEFRTPLNIKKNRQHPFYPEIRKMREDLRKFPGGS